MNFAALPPEVNSTLMYSGPGSGPFLAAATAWEGVAAELRATAAAFDSTVSSLSGQVWLGPSSQAMATAAAPYLTWLTATAAQAEQVAAQVRVASAAYEGAFSMTVPPSIVAANRAQLLILVSTNILGQNTGAIAATEAQYAEMWAQDAAAMYGYAASAAPAGQLTPFTPPPQTTNPAGAAQQAAAVAQDTGGAGAQQGLAQLSSALTGPALAAAAPLQSEIPDLLGLNVIAAISLAASSVGIGVSAGAWTSADASTQAILNEQDHTTEVAETILGAIDLYSPLTPSRPAGFLPLLPAQPATTSAAIGEAVSTGNLSVPISWAANAPEIRSLSYTAPTAAAPTVSKGSVGAAFGEMAIAGMAGSALAGAVNRGGRSVPPVSAPQPPAAAGKDSETERPVTGIAAEIREFAALRDAGMITAEEYAEQKLRLLGAAATPSDDTMSRRVRPREE